MKQQIDKSTLEADLKKAVKEAKAAKEEDRKAIPLNPNGAVMSVMNQVLQQDAMKIAIGSFLEGRELQGKWGLRIVSAEIVPVTE